MKSVLASYNRVRAASRCTRQFSVVAVWLVPTLLVIISGFPRCAFAQSETPLVTFTGNSGAAPGKEPVGLIQASDGNFYGTTQAGASATYQEGSVFVVTPSGVFTTLHVFGGGSDGNTPFGGLVQGLDGNLYGTTLYGGVSGVGTIFKVTVSGSGPGETYSYSTVYSFPPSSYTVGYLPQSSLLLGSDGNFYGITQRGNSGPAVFQYNPISATAATQCTLAASPLGGPVQGSNGAYYQVLSGNLLKFTVSGGSSTCSTTVVSAWNNIVSNLVQGPTGLFYGTVSSSSSSASLFSISLTGSYNTINYLPTQNGFSNMLLGSDGYLYGVDQSDGLLEKISISGTGVTTVHSFSSNGSDGMEPSSIIQGSDGDFYGVTLAGGSASDGTVYKTVPATPLSGPVQLSVSPSTVTTGSAFTLTYTVSNAFSGTLQLCAASNNGGDTSWSTTSTSNAIAGSTTAKNVSLNAPATPGTYTYGLTCGGSESGFATVTVNGATTVTGIAPSSGSTGGGTAVTVNGTNFTAGSTVKFGTQAAASVTINSATSLTAVSPATTNTGAVDVIVTTGVSTSPTSSADVFTYVPPTVTGVSPNSGSAGGTSVTITGTNFASGATVKFGTVSASATFVSSTQLTATAPPTGALGTVDVIVTSGVASAANSADRFTYVQNASTTTLTSAAAATTYGSPVALTATVNNSAAAGTVTFYSGSTRLGSANVSSGVATLTTTSLPVGLDIVLASYSGDTADAASTSNSVSVTVAVPTEPVGTTGPVQSVTINFPMTVTVGSVSVLTQGATGGDFANTNTGTCAAFTTYNAGQSCTVQFTFMPTRPGQRLGAVSLSNTTGTAVVASMPLNGTGTAPLATFPATTTTSSIGSGFTTPYGVALDGNGNLFVADAGANTIYAVNTSNGSKTAVGSGFNSPRAVAVDGSGDVFVADYGSGTVKEIVAVNGSVSATSTVTQVGSGFTNPRGIAVDASGNVYVADFSASKVVEIVAVNGQVSQTSALVRLPSVSGYQGATGVAVDPLGNVFVANYGKQQIVEVVATGGTVTAGSSTQLVNSGFATQAVAVDGVGNLFTQVTGTSLVLLTATGGSAGSNSIILQVGPSTTTLRGIAVDTLGHVYDVQSSGTAVVEVDTTAAPAHTFVSTAVGATSSDSPYGVPLFNEGNATLTFSSIATAAENFQYAASAQSFDCSSGTVSAVTPCSANVSFAPRQAGTDTDTLTFTDNSLNASGTTQGVPLQGNATQGSKTISFANLAATQIAGTAVQLSATSSNNDPVTFSVTSGTARLSAVSSSTTNNVTTYTATLTLTNTGSVVIAANSAATANATAATAVSQTLKVNAPAAVSTAVTQPVGGTSATQTAYVYITGAGKPTAINVLTLGNPNGEYAMVSGGTCSTSVTYSTGQYCIVLYNFTPTRPGQRLGAVTLTTSAGLGLQGVAPLGSTGTSSLLIFPQGTTTYPAGGGLTNPYGIVLDDSGNLFVADAGAHAVYEFTMSNGYYSGSPVTINSSFNSPRGVAIDGSGNLYVADFGAAAVKEIVAVNGTVSSNSPVVSLSSSFTFTSPRGIAVDSTGNVYVADYGASQIYRIKAVNGTVNSSSQVVTLPGAAYSYPTGVAVDPGGNVFVANYGGANVIETVATGGMVNSNSATISLATLPGGTAGNPPPFPIALATDGVGNLFVAVSNYSVVAEYEATGGTISGSTQPFLTGAGMANLSGIALDSQGQLFAVSTGASTPQEVYFRNFLQHTFATTAVGSTSSDSPYLILVENEGNSPLNFTLIGLNGDTNFTVSASTTCSTGQALAASANCTLAPSYTPEKAGTNQTAGLVTYNNSLNTAAESISLLTGNATASQPAVTGVSPASAITGATVTVSGTNLYGTTSVSFGANAATSFTINSNTSITAVVPAGSGTVDVTVSNGTYASATSSADRFSYLTAQTISFTALQNPSFSGTTATLTATGGGSGNPVVFAVVSGPATLIGSSQTTGQTTTQTIAFTGAGTVTLSANQAAGNGYAAAPQATQTISVLLQQIFVVNNALNRGSVTALSDNGTVQNSGVSGGGLGATVDANGYVWSVYASGAGLSKFTDAGALSASLFAANLTSGTAVAIDGNSVNWISQGGSKNNLFAVSSANVVLSTTGLAQAGNIGSPSSVAIDTTGSVWIANFGNDTVTEVIGVAAPVTTPIVQQVINQTPGAKP